MAATVKMSYTKHLDRAARSVRYIAFRSRDIPHEKRGAFSRSSDHADIRRFIDSLHDPLTADRPLRGGRVFQPAKMHRLVFSLSRAEFDKSGLTSWKPVVREALAEWERARGIRLEWIAAEHLSPTHPHVHIALKSVYRDADGTPHRLKVNREMLQDLRQCVRTVVQRHRERHWREIEEQRSIEREARAGEMQLQRSVERVLRGLLYDLEQLAREEERSPLVLNRPRRRRPARRDQDRGSR